MTRALVVMLLLVSAQAWAHKPSDAHLRLDVHGDRVTGRLDIAVRDLEGALSIDDGDGQVGGVKPAGVRADPGPPPRKDLREMKERQTAEHQRQADADDHRQRVGGARAARPNQRGHRVRR